MDRLCEHYTCRCARAAELAAMDDGSGRLTREAIDVHEKRVRCRQPEQKKEEPCSRRT